MKNTYLTDKHADKTDKTNLFNPFSIRSMRVLSRRRSRKILAILLSVLFVALSVRLAFFSPREAEAAWWNDSWSYRQKIVISKTVGAETNVYIAFDVGDRIDTSTLITAGKMQSDCGDIRFTNEGGNLLPMILNSGDGACNTATTDMDVFFDSISVADHNIYMYYGNSNVINGFEATGFTTEATNYTIGTPASEETGPGPIAYWKFNEGADNTCNGGEDACDQTANANDGTFSSAPVWQSEDMCVDGKCLLFDGSDDYVDINGYKGIAGASDRSVSAWIRTSVGADQSILFWGDTPAGQKYEVRLDQSGSDWVLRVENSSGNIFGSTHIADGRWHHVAVTFTGSDVLDHILYVDGQEDAFGGGTTTAMNTGSNYDVTIGTNADGLNRYFDGFIDEVNIYPYARTADQVKQDYVRGGSVHGISASFGPDNSFLSDGLVAYWDFPEATGSATLDKSGNSLDGTLTNAQETAIADTTSTTTTVIDTDGSLSSTDDVYIDMILEITNGSCGAAVGETRIITDYAQSTNTVTVGTAFSSEPDLCGYIIKHQLGGKFGNSMSFDGDNDFVNVGDQTLLELQPPFTLSAWINLDQLSSSGGPYQIISKYDSAPNREWLWELGTNDDFYLWKSHDGTNGEYIALPAGATIFSSDVGEWVHLVVTVDESSIAKFYKNTTYLGSDTVANSTWYSGSTLVNMGRKSNNADYLDGQLDEVRVYNRALSPAEIQALYNWAPGPVAYYPFDEGTGTTTVYDRSGNGHTGTMVGSMTESDWVPGRFGSALDFDGSDDAINVTDTATLSSLTSFTLETWIRPMSFSPVLHPVISKGDSAGNKEYRLRFINTNTINCHMSTDGSAESGGSATYDLLGQEWLHVSCTWDGSKIRIYVNGDRIDDDTLTASGVMYDAGVNLRLGSFSNGANFATDQFDETRIYNYARTAQQVVEDMNAGHPAPGSPVGSALLHYKFDEGYGDTAYDSGTGENNGNLAGTDDTCPQTSDSACPSWTNSGKYGKALDFDTAGTTDDYVLIPYSDDLNLFNSSASLSVWINTTSTGSNVKIVTRHNDGGAGGNGGGPELDINSGSLRFNESEVAVLVTTPEPSSGVWHHVVGVLDTDSDTAYLYLDGNLVSSAAGVTNEFDTSAFPWWVGVDPKTTRTEYFDGQIDGVRIYNNALTADQVKLVYNQGSASVWGATSSNTSGTGSNDALAAYCPPGSTDSCTGPIAEWKFNENTGTSAFDTSENGNTGTLTNGPAWTNIIGAPRWANGLGGSALFFDGASGLDQDDYVDAGTDTTIDDVFDGGGAISIWLNPGSSGEGSTGNILRKGTGATGWFFRTENCDANSVDLKMETGNASTDGQWRADCALSTNQWNHVAVTYDDDATANDPTFYINGVPTSLDLDINPDVAYVSDASQTLYIGNSGSGGLSTFDGLIDEARFYNYVRAQSQIAWEYNRGGPIAHWKFDECQGATAYDSGSGGNNGTITEPGAGSNTSIGTCSSGAGDEMWDNGTTGKRNASLDFDNTDDYVEITNSAGGPLDIVDTAVTLAAWVNLDQIGESGVIVVKGDSSDNPNRERNYSLQYNSDNTVQFRFNFNGNGAGWVWYETTNAVVTSANQWYHLAVTHTYGNGAATKIYINGVEAPAGWNGNGDETVFASNSEPLTIGATDAAGVKSNYFDGRIDDLRIYNYALTQEQIRNVMNENSAVRFGPSSGSP